MKRKRSKKANRQQQDWSLNLDVVHPQCSHYVAAPPDRDAEPCGTSPVLPRTCGEWRLGKGMKFYVPRLFPQCSERMVFHGASFCTNYLLSVV